MKAYRSLIGLVLVSLLTGCASVTTVRNYDDVYYSGGGTSRNSGDYIATYDGGRSGKTTVVNINDYDMDDYTDFQYSSNIRRFDPYSLSDDYFGDVYINNYYYSGNPYDYGSIIYVNDYRPWWRSGYRYGVTFGWYNPWYNGWYDPWYSSWYDPWYGSWYNPWYSPWYYGGGCYTCYNNYWNNPWYHGCHHCDPHRPWGPYD